MKLKRPVLITFIGDLNLLGAFLIIISFFPIPNFIEQYGVSVIPIVDLLDATIRILSVLAMLIISYGYFRLKKWGYGLMITYNLFFLVLSMIFILTFWGINYLIKFIAILKEYAKTENV